LKAGKKITNQITCPKTVSKLEIMKPSQRLTAACAISRGQNCRQSVVRRLQHVAFSDVERNEVIAMSRMIMGVVSTPVVCKIPSHLRGPSMMHFQLFVTFAKFSRQIQNVLVRMLDIEVEPDSV